jgi:hypothetical protein
MMTRKRTSEEENPDPKRPVPPTGIQGPTSPSTQPSTQGVPATQFPSSTQNPLEGPPQTPQAQPSFGELVNQVIILTRANDETTKQLDETNKQLNGLTKNLERLTNALTDRVEPAVPNLSNLLGATDPRAAYGKTPQEILANQVSWLTESFIIEVISRKLEVKDLIKLLPEEERPKGRTVPHGAGVFFDIASKTTTITEGGATAYDKDIPDLSTLMSILSIYGLLRTIYDQDNTSIGAAIFLYQKTLLKWYKHDRYTFSSIRAYFIAHFRQYQTSDDPDTWMRVDTQLFMAHLVRAAPPNETSNSHRDNQSSNKRFNFHGQQGGPPKGSAAETICSNYNNPLKNCSWSGCPRQHICDTCGGAHTAYRCNSNFKGQTNSGGRGKKP